MIFQTDWINWSTEREKKYKKIPGFVKVLAPVTDASWSLVEVKVSLCPRQDPDEDPFTCVNVTHRVSRKH